VVEDFLGDFRPDYWVSDRYGGQLGWANKACQDFRVWPELLNIFRSLPL
jgi:hypothetical protein